MNDQKGTGVTTRQIRNAPPRAIYLWVDGRTTYAQKLAEHLGRSGWNGRGIFIRLQMPDENSLMTAPYIYIDTTRLDTSNLAAPKVRVPWLARQTDMLAEDWILVD